MRGILFMLCMFTGLIAYSQQPSEKVFPDEVNSLENPLKADPSAAKYGARVYKKVCFVCHGTNGNGQGPQIEELETKPADFNHQTVVGRTDGALFWWISNGGNDMQPFRDVLTEEEIWQVVSYVRSVQTK